MKTRIIAVFAGLATILGTATGALAGGESGIAGSAAFSINTNAVTGVAVSAAVGKHDASSFAHQDSAATMPNVAGALGSDAVITQTITNGLVSKQQGSVDATNGLTANGNSFTDSALGTIQLGTASTNTIFQAR